MEQERVNSMSKVVLYEGPDLSYHNGTVNIKKIRDAGYKQIGLRAGYGKNNIDQKYVSNAEACRNLLVNVILYWFSYAYTVAMATAEAEYAIAQAAKYWIICAIAFDFEYDSVLYARKRGFNLTRQTVTDMAIAFLKTVKQAGQIPVIYTNRDYLRNYFDMDRIVAELGEVYVWYARYTSKLSESEIGVADIWQYTSSGKIPGVSGKVDLNRFYKKLTCVPIPVEHREETCNINILDFQHAANLDGYQDADGNPLKEDGKDGPKTQFVRKQINLKAKHIGILWRTGSTGAVVEWWQRRCNEILGHDQEEDGKYGKMARSETLELQKKLNLVTDGIAGYDSLQMAFYN